MHRSVLRVAKHSAANDTHTVHKSPSKIQTRLMT